MAWGRSDVLPLNWGWSHWTTAQTVEIHGLSGRRTLVQRTARVRPCVQLVSCLPCPQFSSTKLHTCSGSSPSKRIHPSHKLQVSSGRDTNNSTGKLTRLSTDGTRSSFGTASMCSHWMPSKYSSTLRSRRGLHTVLTGDGRYLEPEWESSATFQAFKSSMIDQADKDQCCMDCNTCANPHEIEDTAACRDLSGFETVPVHTAMEQELLALAAGILAGLHLAYVQQFEHAFQFTELTNTATTGKNFGWYFGVRCFFYASGVAQVFFRPGLMTKRATSMPSGWPRLPQDDTAGET